MAITVKCPSCDKALRIGEEHQGKTVRCPACQKPFKAPVLSEQDPDAGPKKIDEYGQIERESQPKSPERRREPDDEPPPRRRRDEYDDEPPRRRDDYADAPRRRDD